MRQVVECSRSSLQSRRARFGQGYGQVEGTFFAGRADPRPWRATSKRSRTATVATTSFPNKLAVLATRDELQRADKLRKAAEDRRLKEAQDWQEIANTLAESPIEVEVRTGPTGRLYGSVTSAIIAEKIAEKIDREVNRRNIRIPAPIRTIGIYTVEAKFVGGVDANLKVSVVSDSESKEISSAIEAMEAEAAEAAEAAEGEAGDAPAGEDEESAT